MGRPRTDFPTVAALRALADEHGKLALRVTPGARSEALKISEDAVLVKVRAKAKEGEANEAVLALLAEALGVAPSRLQMLRGATGRNKLVQLPPA